MAGCGKTPGKAGDPSYLYVSKIADKATLVDLSNSVGGLSMPAPNLTEASLARHLDGDASFEKAFIPGPDDAHPGHVGLGPVFNNTSCLNCHARDGRGFLPPVPSGQARVKLGSNESLLLRISVEGLEALPKDADHLWGAPQPVPGFSGQLFHRGIYGLRPDSPGTGQADVYLSYESRVETYPDGRQVTLRKPLFAVENAYDGAASRLYQNDVRQSPRLAPPVAGLGLLEAISEDDILAQADPDDANGDGISGKPNWVLDLVKQAAGNPTPLSLGRFGWKASTPHLLQQTVAALNNDMGVVSTLLPTQNIFGTLLYDAFLALVGSDLARLPTVEADDDFVDGVTFYSRTLGIPERRNVEDSTVLQGGRLFAQVQCIQCHAGAYEIKDWAEVPEFSGLKIYPFTDLLLHDMGEGLADNRRDFDADGREWRTTPLWGIGLTKLVNARAGFLHDGRARTLEEAILWHGGEAAGSVEAFKNLSAADRESLLRFIESL